MECVKFVVNFEALKVLVLFIITNRYIKSEKRILLLINVYTYLS